MQMQCVSDFANELGAWRAGEVVNVSPETAAYLARCSPDSWRIGLEAPARPAAGDDDPEKQERIDAMSTETASGLVAPDRMTRGGRQRTNRG